MKIAFRVSLLSACISAMFGAVPAVAQTASPTDDVAALPTVVVTAQKRTQSLQDVPISMTVLGEEALEKARVRSLTDIQQMAPNVEATASGGGSISVVKVRGVGGGGIHIGFGTRVGVYLDGIYVGQSAALDQPLSDIEQIEVLRGPQGQLFGRNTNAGAISITTRAPSQTFEASVSGGVGNYGGVEVGGAVSGPISSDVSGKFSVAKETRDGYVTNLYDGHKINNLDTTSARGQLSYRPNQNLKVDLYADSSTSDQNVYMGEAVGGRLFALLPNGPLPHGQVNLNTTPHRNADLSGLGMAINYALDSGNKLTAITGYRDTRQNRASDLDGSPKDVLRTEYSEEFKQTSQEIRIASPNSGNLRYVAGLYLLNEDATTNRRAIVGQDGALARAIPGTVITNDGKITTNTYAVFGSVDYEFATDWTLNLGARVTEEKKDVLFNLDGAKLGYAALTGYTDSRSENRVTPTAGVSYAASKDMNLYAKYSTGFKSGGWNTDWLRPNQISNGLRFDTETVKSYEVGAKGTLLAGRMQWDAAAFSSNFDNYQEFQSFIDATGSNVRLIRNAAKVDTRGVEASARLRVSRDLTVGGSLGVLHAEYKSFPGGGTDSAGKPIDLSGQRLVDTPNLTAALNVTYGFVVPSVDGRFELSGDYSHRSSTTLSAPPDLAARDLVNARLNFTPNSGKWTSSLWVRNLTNQDYVMTRVPDAYITWEPRGLPRMFGVNAKYYF